ncbi:tRNA (guanosine(37)-N1)-methyltransferase TrmD [Plasticicumulans acidivorans]|uniref:tRNA (guanine-N(1)-)-methyltransferase n=1 Tax=Plasticicumulans acidivorans TaxID=886464 RepID=A0A317MPX0_9GAMM|nr:tRNA (guanosine(37)-N1)-methyltransferase TrmD [Plasticicumulans acidivorans]PWV58587.1 tRNA (guanine37-N(1)-) methyltransferase [Plasticicumulans acidivorans]
MRIDVVTLFPAFFEAFLAEGVTGRGVQRGLLEVHTWNPRDHARDRHASVDDRPYGGGPGMLMKLQTLRDAIGQARTAAGSRGRTIYLSPQGRRLDQAGVAELASEQHLLLVCGRYEGIDERIVLSEIDEEWSIGDYVLSGGELAAAVMIDAVSRLEPGVLGNEASHQQDSFMDGLLDCPHYTRPEEIDGLRVPPVLLSGDHAAIARWRRQQALGRTWLRRPDLLAGRVLDSQERTLLDEFIRQHELESQGVGAAAPDPTEP